MKNYVQPGDTLTFVAPSALAPGDGFLVGSLFAVAAAAAASGAEVEGDTVGVFDLTCLTTDTVVSPFMTKAYWDNTNKRVTTLLTGNTLIGVFVKSKANGETTGRVRLNGIGV